MAPIPLAQRAVSPARRLEDPGRADPSFSMALGPAKLSRGLRVGRLVTIEQGLRKILAVLLMAAGAVAAVGGSLMEPRSVVAILVGVALSWRVTSSGVTGSPDNGPRLNLKFRFRSNRLSEQM